MQSSLLQYNLDFKSNFLQIPNHLFIQSFLSSLFFSTNFLLINKVINSMVLNFFSNVIFNIWFDKLQKLKIQE
jgi:hypothetical protein